MNVRWRIFCAAFFCAQGILIGQTARQPEPNSLPPACEKRIAAIRKYTIGKKERTSAMRRSLLFRQNPVCFSELLATGEDFRDKFRTEFNKAFKKTERAKYANFLKTLEARRTDKQAGSSAGTGGSTNLVSKGFTAQALSLATEYGALAESTSKQVVTVQGSLGAIGAGLIRAGLFEYCPSGEATVPRACIHGRDLRFLRRISYGFSFDTSRSSQTVSGTPSGSPTGNAQPVTFAPAGHEISAITARFVVVNKRDYTSNRFRDLWKDRLSLNTANASTRAFLDTAATQLLQSLGTLLDKLNLREKSWYDSWLESSVSDLKTSSEENLETTWRMHATEFLKEALKRYPNLMQDAADLLQKTTNYRLEEDEFVSSIADEPALSVEYNYNRPIGQPDTSTVRVIFDKGVGADWSFTANGAVSIYDSSPSASIPDSSRLRNIQAGLAIERKLPSLAFLGAPTLSGTYYFQYQNSPSVINVDPATPLPGITFTGLPSDASQVFVQKGKISIGQLKLVLGTGKSGLRIPLAVSYSNRTELITKPTWRAQIGVSYDFDSLFVPSGTKGSAASSTGP